MLNEKLNELNIFALRDLARKTGVSSPTSKTKEELINRISAILNGEEKPMEKKTKQGRPPKMFGYDYFGIFNNNSVSTKLQLNQESVDYEACDVVTVVGTLEITQNNSAILLVNQQGVNYKYLVPKDVLSVGNFKTGDRLVVEVDPDENRKIVCCVYNINGCPIASFSHEREDYINIPHVDLIEPLTMLEQVDGLQINKGENVYVYGSNNKQNTSVALKVLNSVKIQNKIYVNVSVTEKNRSALIDNKAEMFISNINEDIADIQRVVVLAVERAKRILESGEDVLIVVDDMLSVYGAEKEKINLIRNLASLSKNTKNHGSITLFAIMPDDSLNQIEKLSDKRYVIADNKLTEINPAPESSDVSKLRQEFLKQFNIEP